jgi:AcrR family transcriptional regulator/DNA-binding MarR family transcriptional regulator
MQRARMLSAAVEVVAEVGYARMSVERVTRHAGVSHHTFFEVFEDREDCFLAAFDDVLGRIAGVVLAAYEREQGWPEQVRAALAALLELLEGEPAMSTFVLVEALAAGPKILAHRAEVLEEVMRIFEEKCAEVRIINGREVSGVLPLTVEGAVNGLLGILHTRMVEETPRARVQSHRPLTALINPLTAMIVLPYMGYAAAAKELSRPVADGARPRRSAGVNGAGPPRPRKGALEMEPRITYRTLRVLTAIAELSGRGSGPSNREVADHAGIKDEGQVSRLLARLKQLGLVEKIGGDRTQGEPNAWRLTSKGRQVLRAVTERGDASPGGSQDFHSLSAVPGWAGIPSLGV